MQVLELPPDDLWTKLEEVRRQVDHLYRLRDQVLEGQLPPRQVTQYQALLLRERQLLADLAKVGPSERVDAPG